MVHRTKDDLMGSLLRFARKPIPACLVVACIAVVTPLVSDAQPPQPLTSPQSSDLQQASQQIPLVTATATDTPQLSSPYAPTVTSRQATFPSSVHEYGPPGYLRRRAGDGPSAPLFVAKKSAIPVTPLVEQDQFVTRGSFAKSYKIPGTNTSYRWGGFIHLDGMFTFDPMDATDDFVTATIPVPRERGQNANFTARNTRLEWETHTEDSLLGDVKTFLQVDFFNGNEQSVFASFPIRTRFAYVDVGWFRFGQDASNFMDYGVFPNTIDYEGPGSMMLIRNPQARVTNPVTEKFKIALSAEQPFSDVTLPTDLSGATIGDNIQDMPDFVGHLRYDTHLGHGQLAGMLRKLTYQPPDGEKLNELGYGIAFSGDIHPWAWLLGRKRHCCSLTTRAIDKCRMMVNYAAGDGIARYVQDANGLGLDAALDSSGEFQTLGTTSWFACYEHWWTTQWNSNFCYGENNHSGTDAIPGNTYAGAKYLATNLLWVPNDRFYTGVEYLWGERQNLDGQSARARRIQFGAQYNF